MDPQRDDYEEIGVFEATSYFSESSSSNMHCHFLHQISIPNTQAKHKAQNISNITNSTLDDLHKNPKKLPKKEKDRIRLLTLFNYFFHHSKKKRLKSLEDPVDTNPKSYPLSPQRNNIWKHEYQSNDGLTGDLWRDRRLEGIRVVGKRWVLNNFVNEEVEGLVCKDMSCQKGLSEKDQEQEYEDEVLSDSDSDLFELENCN